MLLTHEELNYIVVELINIAKAKQKNLLSQSLGTESRSCARLEHLDQFNEPFHSCVASGENVTFTIFMDGVGCLAASRTLLLGGVCPLISAWLLLRILPGFGETIKELRERLKDSSRSKLGKLLIVSSSEVPNKSKVSSIIIIMFIIQIIMFITQITIFIIQNPNF